MNGSLGIAEGLSIPALYFDDKGHPTGGNDALRGSELHPLLSPRARLSEKQRIRKGETHGFFGAFLSSRAVRRGFAYLLEEGERLFFLLRTADALPYCWEPDRTAIADLTAASFIDRLLRGFDPIEACRDTARSYLTGRETETPDFAGITVLSLRLLGRNESVVDQGIPEAGPEDPADVTARLGEALSHLLRKDDVEEPLYLRAEGDALTLTYYGVSRTLGYLRQPLAIRIPAPFSYRRSDAPLALLAALTAEFILGKL